MRSLWVLFSIIIIVHLCDVVKCISSRIAYGDIAKPGQFPYHVLFKIDDDYGYNWCGGVLISKKYMLTTAECLEIGNPHKAYIGVTNITESSLTPNIKRLSIDPENDFIFSPNNGKLGLVIIRESFKFSNLIKPAVLPSSRLSQQDVLGKTAVLTGFGVPLARHADTSKLLRYIEVPIIASSVCEERYPDFFDENNYLCASSIYGKSFCFGDQGGPLVVQDENDSNIVVGIAYTQGAFCGDDKWPGVYIRVSSYLNWINYVTNIDV